MKKIIAFVALAALVSSCGNKMTLMKRHYTKGFYFHHSGQEAKPEIHASIDPKTMKMEPVVVKDISDEMDKFALIAEANAPVIEKKTDRSFQSQLVRHKEGHKLSNPKKISVSLKKYSSNLLDAKKRQRSGNDGNLIVQVILALFPILCLIAVYLHDGGITTNFWVTLVLHLLLYAECIFALLVVLGVVDLA